MPYPNLEDIYIYGGFGSLRCIEDIKVKMNDVIEDNILDNHDIDIDWVVFIDEM